MPHLVRHDQPLPLHDVAATRQVEAWAAARLPTHTLMQRAGLALAQLASALAPHARSIWIACGPGTNGGDGLEAAMHLQRWGRAPIVTWLGDADRAPPDARAACERARAAGVRFADAPPDVADWSGQDLCIDALLGIGAARAPTGAMAEALQRMANTRALCLAVDVPSGLNADTGQWLAPLSPVSIAACADRSSAAGQFHLNSQRHTLSLLTLKPGLFTGQGRDACGTVWFDGLGADPAAAPLAAPSAWLSGAPAPSERAHASHKGSYGDVAVIGGEVDTQRGTAMAGAALLAARAALHGGAGRVYVGLLGDDGPWRDDAQPELMFRRPGALELAQLTVVCGCGGGKAVAATLPGVLQAAPRLVLDADALNAIAASRSLAAALTQRAARGHATVLTPHPLEAARLHGRDTAAVQADRLAAAQALAERFQCVAALKGSGTVIAAPGRVPHINPTGNARLATAGTGDVLAGLVGARLASGLAPHRAACDAVYAHGALADAWEPGRALTASALAHALRP